jgi:hypothetical protein|tara:strand:+ start:1371 stop:1556 length:186 start_codon:yes stop_codon:yes gene_type:complete
MKSRVAVNQQNADISVGSELSIGKVVKIRHDGVDIENKGNEFFVSRQAIEKVFADDRRDEH